MNHIDDIAADDEYLKRLTDVVTRNRSRVKIRCITGHESIGDSARKCRISEKNNTKTPRKRHVSSSKIRSHDPHVTNHNARVRIIMYTCTNPAGNASRRTFSRFRFSLIAHSNCVWLGTCRWNVITLSARYCGLLLHVFRAVLVHNAIDRRRVSIFRALFSDGSRRKECVTF